MSDDVLRSLHQPAVPDHVRRLLKHEVTIARAAGTGTDQWVSIICDLIDNNTQQYGMGWRWKPPIVVPDEPCEPIAAPAGPRSDVPPTHPPVTWWPVGA